VSKNKLNCGNRPWFYAKPVINLSLEVFFMTAEQYNLFEKSPVHRWRGVWPAKSLALTLAPLEIISLMQPTKSETLE